LQHLDAFEEATAAEGDGFRVPSFARNALRATAGCGDLTLGFVRLHCDRCRTDRIVPFSCKGPLCPSCAGRRMSDLAAYLVDRILPHVPYRQWVVSLPFHLRLPVSFDSDLCNDVFRIAKRAIFACVERIAAEEGVVGTPAGIVHLQRFGDALSLNPHGHFVVSDGVFNVTVPAGPDVPPVVLFRTTRAPTPQELAGVAQHIEDGLVRLFARRAARADRDATPADEETHRAQAILTRFAQAKPVAERQLLDAGPSRAQVRPPNHRSGHARQAASTSTPAWRSRAISAPP